MGENGPESDLDLSVWDFGAANGGEFLPDRGKLPRKIFGAT